MAKILLIDDEGVVRGALKALLAAKGHSVAEAASGREALDRFKAEPPALILLDRDLPDMRGSQVLEEVRKTDKEVLVIVLTGNPNAGGEEKYRALGISHFLSKGMSIEVLLKVVELELAKAGATGAPQAEPARILVADDDPGVRSVLKRFLEMKGYRVQAVENGKQAVDAMASFRPALVLLDIDMPVMSGVEALPKIVEAGGAVMMISGNDDLETARKCMTLGACDFIVKPLNLEYLELSVWSKVLVSTP